MPIKFLIPIIGLVFFFSGLHDIWIATANRRPTKMSCTQYFSNPTSAAWVELSGCNIDYLESYKVYKEGKEDSTSSFNTSFYAPVRLGDDKSSSVVLAAEAPTDINIILHELFKLTDNAEKDANEASKLKSFIINNYDRLVLENITINGLISKGSELKDLVNKDKTKAESSWKLSDNFKVINQNAKPSFKSGLLQALAGFVILVLVYLRFIKNLRLEEKEGNPEKLSEVMSKSND